MISFGKKTIFIFCLTVMVAKNVYTPVLVANIAENGNTLKAEQSLQEENL